MALNKSQSLKDQGKSRTRRAMCSTKESGRNPLKIRASLEHYTQPDECTLDHRWSQSLKDQGKSRTWLFSADDEISLGRNPLKIRASLELDLRRWMWPKRSQSLKDQGKSRTTSSSSSKRS